MSSFPPHLRGTSDVDPVRPEVDLGQARRRRRHHLVVVLTFVTGCIDATGFLALGGAFSSVMTGNMVLFGVSVSSHNTALAMNSGCAIVSYIVGVLVGAKVAGHHRAGDRVWPLPVSRALTLELAALTVFLIMWEAVLLRPSHGLKLSTLMVLAAALGVQGSAVQRFGVSGLSSTYLTGTLTTLIAGFAARHPLRALIPSGQILLALIVGAAAGTLVVKHCPSLSPALALLPVGGVLLMARRLTTAERLHPT